MSRQSSGSKSTKKSQSAKPQSPSGDNPEVEIDIEPGGLTVEVGIGSLELGTDGTIGLGVEVPLPTAPGVSINGGVVINPKTGEIESVSVGADFIDLIEIETVIEGCDIITTTSVSIPKTGFSVSTSVHTEIPGCKPPKKTN